jgi:molybdenum cofactor cytidylyltransferase
MPVDPGNLMLIGDLGGRPVLGAPGCARSPKENGFDWVLMRLLAGLKVTRADVARMGVGGLDFQREELQDYFERHQEFAGQSPDWAGSAVVYSSLQILHQAIERTGSLDHGVIAEEM